MCFCISNAHSASSRVTMPYSSARVAGPPGYQSRPPPFHRDPHTRSLRDLSERAARALHRWHSPAGTLGSIIRCLLGVSFAIAHLLSRKLRWVLPREGRKSQQCRGAACRGPTYVVRDSEWMFPPEDIHTGGWKQCALGGLSLVWFLQSVLLRPTRPRFYCLRPKPLKPPRESGVSYAAVALG